jgi:hypothetical protein
MRAPSDGDYKCGINVARRGSFGGCRVESFKEIAVQRTVSRL